MFVISDWLDALINVICEPIQAYNSARCQIFFCGNLMCSVYKRIHKLLLPKLPFLTLYVINPPCIYRESLVELGITGSAASVVYTEYKKPRLTGGLRSIDQSGLCCHWLGTDEVSPTTYQTGGEGRRRRPATCQELDKTLTIPGKTNGKDRYLTFFLGKKINFSTLGSPHRIIRSLSYQHRIYIGHPS